MNKTKTYILLFICLIFSVGIVFLTSYVKSDVTKQNNIAYNSIISQKLTEVTNESKVYKKLYYKDSLLGVISDYDYIQSLMKEYYDDEICHDYPGVSLTFGEDYYIKEEPLFYNVENIDDKIFNYLKENNGFGIYTDVIDFSTKEGIYDTIAVLKLEDFEQAKNDFIENFISEYDYKRLKNNDPGMPLTEVGEKAIGLRIQETITTRKGIANLDRVFTNKNQVLEFLCFGRNEEREYYTVKEGDTLQGVGFFNHLLSSKQIMMLNPDKIYSTSQIPEPGMELNVTYFTSPITVIVTQECLKIEEVFPDDPLYVERPEKYTNYKEVIQYAENGSKYTLYEEILVNGVRIEGKKISEESIKQPVQAIIEVGTKPKPDVGTGNLIWPFENIMVSCNWGCYAGHKALDLIGRYDRYPEIHAIDNGRVVKSGPLPMCGNYILIDHNNGLKSGYCHMMYPSHLRPGDVVMKGDVIGRVGTTGFVTGPHVHLEFFLDDGTVVDPCNYYDCHSIPWL